MVKPTAGQPSYQRAIMEGGVTHDAAVMLSGELGNTGDNVFQPIQIFGLRNPLGWDEHDATVTPQCITAEMDNEGPWLVTIDQVHHQQHEGEAFYFHDVVTLGSGGVQDYLLTVPAGVEPHFEYDVEGIFGITVELYEGTGKTQSAAVQATFNRNRNSNKVSKFTIKKGTDGGTGDGTRIAWRKNGTGTSQGKLSGSVGDRRERILKPATAYIFRITSAAAANDVSVELDWYIEGARST